MATVHLKLRVITTMETISLLCNPGECTAIIIIIITIIINTQMVAVALGPWASHSEDRAEP